MGGIIILDLEDWSTESLEMRQICEKICDYIIDEKCSIRRAERELCIPRSTIHQYIHTYIKRYYDEEYMQIIRILDYNKRNRFKPRKKWVKYGL